MAPAPGPETSASAPAPGRARIGVVVVAYNAASTLAQVLDRIPVEFRSRIDEVLVCDDASADATYLVGLGYQAQGTDLPITMIRHPRNLGYGGNQKAAYRLASKHGLDIVVLLHGDGQYAPELLPEMVAPLEADECDAVFGSRMLVPGAALRGGMPRYKYYGNRVLTAFENRMLAASLSEFHSGYRAYKVSVLDALDLDACSDGFDFDTQIIIQLHHARRRIKEIPIPTFYGDEICYVNGLQYARQISGEALRYGLGRFGFGVRPQCLRRTGDRPGESSRLDGEQSASRRLLDWLSELPPSRVLAVGCGDGRLAEDARALGHRVTGVERADDEVLRKRVDELVVADYEQGIPAEAGGSYDVVLLANVLEHVRDPESLLADSAARLRRGGRLLVTVPNFGHWYPRLRTVTGHFDYDERGILDRGHVRFFTKGSFERLARRLSLRIDHLETTGLPLGAFGAEPERSPRWQAVGVADRALRRVRPQLFAYELLYELEPR